MATFYFLRIALKNLPKNMKIMSFFKKMIYTYCVYAKIFVILQREMMKRKADNNLLAAQKLINAHTFPTESVHCSYYAVLQKMKYVLAHTDRNPLTYEQQKELAEKDTTNSTHEVILRETRDRIKSPSERKAFVDQLRNLKKERVRADYTEEVFTEDEGLECKAMAESLMKKLTFNFGQL